MRVLDVEVLSIPPSAPKERKKKRLRAKYEYYTMSNFAVCTFDLVLLR